MRSFKICTARFTIKSIFIIYWYPAGGTTVLFHSGRDNSRLSSTRMFCGQLRTTFITEIRFRIEYLFPTTWANIIPFFRNILGIFCTTLITENGFIIRSLSSTFLTKFHHNNSPNLMHQITLIDDLNDKFIVSLIDCKLVVVELFTIEWDTDIGPILFLNMESRRFGLCFCHRRKDRSIWFFGLERIFCSRCLGILIGGIVGLACVFYQYRIGLLWAVLLLLPLILDGLLQAFRYRESNNIIRLITGFLFGIGLQFLLAYLW